MKYKFKQGEGKTLSFSVTRGGVAYTDLASALDLTFVVKQSKSDSEALISKVKEDFTIESNVARVGVLDSDTAGLSPGSYVGELTIAVAADDTVKSADIEIEIERSVSV